MERRRGDKVSKHQLVLNKKCGYDLTTKFDGAGFAAGGFKDPAEICTTGQWAVENLCEHGGKEKAAEQIKSIHCIPGHGDEVTFALSAGEFSLTVGPTAKNVSEKAVAYLKRAVH
jgi:hypothetical protein